MPSNYEAGLRISEYVLEERVGRGTFGEVWRARHHIWDKERVAVKLPTEPDYIRYLQREGMVIHGLRHPNIVGVKGFDPYSEIPYLVMDFIDGPSLAAVVSDHPNGMPIPVVRVVVRGMLRAMRAAHEANILHRDLKPGNVLLNLCGRPLTEMAIEDVKVSDFGLGTGGLDATLSMAHSASLERDNKIVGTLAYLAPELRDGRRKPDARSDLYSLGVVLFEILTGERPAGAESPSYLRNDTPPNLDELFRKLYARHERRFADAAEALAMLERSGAVDGPPPPPPLPTPPARQRVSQSRVVTACGACGSRIQRDDQFCTQCGEQVVDEVRRCSTCGGFPAPNDTYCVHCGAPLSAIA